jgi:hypothetical protein
MPASARMSETQAGESIEITLRRFAWAVLNSTARIAQIHENLMEAFEALGQVKRMIYPVVMNDTHILAHLGDEVEDRLRKSSEWVRLLDSDLQRNLLSFPQIEMDLNAAASQLYSGAPWFEEGQGKRLATRTREELKAALDSERQWFRSQGIPVDDEGKEVFHG